MEYMSDFMKIWEPDAKHFDTTTSIYDVTGT
jgi:hypothetical protein